MMRRAADWLIAIQNPDGGWGEDCDSYKLDYKGYEPAPSTASQTAWALLGLMAAGEVDHPAVARGIAYLQATQDADGLWAQEHYTGGGFPRVFYLRYHGYPKFFPLWALARYRNLKAGNSRRVAATACDDARASPSPACAREAAHRAARARLVPVIGAGDARAAGKRA